MVALVSTIKKVIYRILWLFKYSTQTYNISFIIIFNNKIDGLYLYILYVGASLPCPRPSNMDHSLTCADGTKCNVDDKGWDCCVNHGGRTNCPIMEPVLCSKPNRCVGGLDYCCAMTSRHCITQGAGSPMCPGEFIVLRILRSI